MKASAETVAEIRRLDRELSNNTRFTHAGLDKLRQLARRPCSEETRQKLAEAMRGRPQSPRTKSRMAMSVRAAKLREKQNATV